MTDSGSPLVIFFAEQENLWFYQVRKVFLFHARCLYVIPRIEIDRFDL